MNTLFIAVTPDNLVSFKHLLTIYFLEIDVSFVKAKTIIIYFALKEFVITDVEYPESKELTIDELKEILKHP